MISKLLKSLFPVCILALLISSCAGSKMARGYEKSIDGTWQLETIQTEKIGGDFNAQLFNEEEFSCFIGSTWKFNKNGNLGSYDISKNGGDCIAIKRDIRWSIYEPATGVQEFQFKRLTTGLKTMDDGAGYRFKIINMSKESMQLKSDLQFEGRTVSFIYNFVKI